MPPARRLCEIIRAEAVDERARRWYNVGAEQLEFLIALSSRRPALMSGVKTLSSLGLVHISRIRFRRHDFVLRKAN